LNAAFAPAISSNIPWAAVLGNSREGVMKHIVGLKNTVSRVNPVEAHIIDGFGNYDIEVGGVEGCGFENKSVLNLYFLDSGDYSTVSSILGYGWIKPSQQLWFERTSAKLRVLTSFCIEYHKKNTLMIICLSTILVFIAESIHGQARGSERTCTGACILSHSVAGIRKF